MTQLQTREQAQTPSEPVHPQDNGKKWTAIVVVGVLALMAAAFGLAMWLASDTESVNQTGAETISVETLSNVINTARAATVEPSSVEIVQAQIDAALAALNAEPSSVGIVQAEIDAALAQIEAARRSAGAEDRAQADDEAAFGAPDSNPIPDWVGDRTVYWPGAHVKGIEASVAGPKALPGIALPEIPGDNYEPDGGLDAISFTKGGVSVIPTWTEPSVTQVPRIVWPDRNR